MVARRAFPFFLVTMPSIISATILDIGEFKAFYFNSRPPRLEAAVGFDTDHFSQKLVFRLMDITHRHGFACASPRFGTGEDEGKLVFCIGTSLPSSRSLRRYSAKLHSCLQEVLAFHEDFMRQMDFSRLDVSMFNGSVPFDPSLLASVRDQHYGGSWDAFKKDMMDEERPAEAEIVDRCQRFETVNSKDIGLVGQQLEHTLAMLEEDGLLVREEIN